MNHRPPPGEQKQQFKMAEELFSDNERLKKCLMAFMG
jgi:hypothetical protein